MVLAAGRGMRLRPWTATTPKPLVPVAGRPMLYRVLDRLQQAGIRTVHLNHHHLGEQLTNALGDGSDWGLSLTTHGEATLLGTGGGLKNVLTLHPELQSAPLLMINSDVLTDLVLGDLFAHHLASGALVTLVLRPDPQAADFGVIGTDDTGRVSRFLTTVNGPVTAQYMFTGIQVIAPELLTQIAGRPGDDEVFAITEPYMQQLADGGHMNSWIHHGYWADLGTPERLQRAEADIRAGRVAGACAVD